MTYDINSNLLAKTGLTAGQLQSAARSLRADNGFVDFQAFVDAENQYNLNSLFILAHAAVESAWGTSYYARARNNLFGFNAVDSNPDEAASYSSQRASILFYADFMSRYYLHPGEVYYNGATSHGVFVKYSSSHDAEAATVVSIMNSLAAHVGTNPAPTPAPTPTPPAPNAQTYVVRSGDNMSSIAVRFSMSLAQLEQLNPHAGHPAGNFGTIWPGDVLVVSGTPVPQPPAPKYYTVKSGDNMSAIASSNGMTLARLEQLNPNAGHPSGNFNVIWPSDQLRVA